ncbi:MAG TPA: FAD-dependent oxidoreductase [Solirubrobacterales bacterium]|nr:FAD-dependent oxidoreductase [Solirubrobacterales bacterium]
MSGERVDIAVVGAGLAGLSAARGLVAAGRSVVVLEAMERVGGRTLNHTFSDGTVVETGGQWVGPTQDRLYALAAELGVAHYPTWDEGENLLHRGGELTRYEGETFGLPLYVAADLALVQWRLDRLAGSVPLEAPWAAPKAGRLDGETVATWIRRNVRTPLGRTSMRVVVEAVFSAEPEDISMLHFLFYLHSGGSIDLLTRTTGGAQESRFVGGSQEISIRLADGLGAEVVRLASPVRAIEEVGDGLRLSGAWGSVEAERAVVAVPPAVIPRIAFDPPLSGRRSHLYAKMPPGYVIKCSARYERPFWRERGLSGQAGSVEHPLALVFDNSPQVAGCGVLTGFLEGVHGRRAAALDPERRRSLVIDGFATYFGPEAREVAEYVEQDWAEEEWIRGGYGAHMGPGVWTHYGSLLRRPEGRVHWAGSETSPVWNGYMDGAIRSGERAAAEILAG